MTYNLRALATIHDMVTPSSVYNNLKSGMCGLLKVGYKLVQEAAFLIPEDVSSYVKTIKEVDYQSNFNQIAEKTLLTYDLSKLGIICLKGYYEPNSFSNELIRKFLKNLGLKKNLNEAISFIDKNQKYFLDICLKEQGLNFFSRSAIEPMMNKIITKILKQLRKDINGNKIRSLIGEIAERKNITVFLIAILEAIGKIAVDVKTINFSDKERERILLNKLSHPGAFADFKLKSEKEIKQKLKVLFNNLLKNKFQELENKYSIVLINPLTKSIAVSFFCLFSFKAISTNFSSKLNILDYILNINIPNYKDYKTLYEKNVINHNECCKSDSFYEILYFVAISKILEEINLSQGNNDKDIDALWQNTLPKIQPILQRTMWNIELRGRDVNLLHRFLFTFGICTVGISDDRNPMPLLTRIKPSQIISVVATEINGVFER